MAVSEKTVIQNRRARHDYFVLEQFEAGLELRGTEVKSLRAGHLTFKDSYVDILDNQAYLVGAHISPYEQGTYANHAPERPRRLLMHKREIIRLKSQVAEKGLTLIPLRVYFKKGIAKLEVGLCKGKRTFDKRDTLQERDAQREIDRAIKGER